MSVRVMSKVFRDSRSTGSARLVLLALADVAADTGEVTAYARSHSVLAAKANCELGTVRKALRALEDLGEVEILVVGDGRTKSDYRIILPGLGGPDSDEKTPQGGRDAPPITPSPSVETSSSENTRAALDASFESWWLTYPARDGKTRGDKPRARVLWGKLTEEERVRVVRATPNYTAATEPRFVKNAEGWLRARYFDDWQEPGKPRKGSEPRNARAGSWTPEQQTGEVRLGEWDD